VDNPAYDKALKLLGRRDHFRAELAKKLRDKGFEDDDIEQALERLVELDLVDDRRLAGRFAELRAVDRGWGPRRVEIELRRRGVERHLAERASRLEDEILDRALETALRRVAARAREGWWRLPEGRVRLIKSLIGRGFATDVASAAITQLAADKGSSDHEIDDQSGDPGRLS